MTDKKTKFLVGLFVACGLATILMTVIWLGMSNFFKQGKHFAAYFDESVQGLDVEAPVKYRGVSIGRVERIRVAADAHLIEVILEMDQEIRFKDEIYAQLKVVGITGNMFIELDHFKGEEVIQPTLNFPTGYPVIPTRTSDIKQLFKQVDEMVTKINTIDIADILLRLKTTLEHMDNAIVNTDTKALSDHMLKTLDNIDKVVANPALPNMIQRLDTTMATLEQAINELHTAELSKEAKETVATLRHESQSLLRSAEPLIEDSTNVINAAGQSINDLNQKTKAISNELEKTIATLNTLLEKINDQPSQLLFGEAPPRRMTETKQ